MLSLETRFILTMPQGTITDAGRGLIITYINSQRIREGNWKELNPDTTYNYLMPLPDDWAWVWVVTEKTEYTGTFAKRLSKFYHQTMKLKCPPEFIQEIGNLARTHSSEAFTYEFEFVDKIEWDAGDFGDDGSCWWSDYSEARTLLLSHGGLAIRFYEDNAGRGRAWVVPSGELFFVFNGYGFSGDSTLIIVRVMAQFLNISYKKISLVNHNDLMYINNDSGYVLGRPDLIQDFTYHNFAFGLDENATDDESDEDGETDERAGADANAAQDDNAGNDMRPASET